MPKVHLMWMHKYSWSFLIINHDPETEKKMRTSMVCYFLLYLKLKSSFVWFLNVCVLTRLVIII